MKLRALDLFSGCGGLATGLTWAGLRTAWANEIDDDACQTFTRNHPDVEVFNQSITDFLVGVEERRGGYPKKGQVDLLAGGPPCQGFCQINRHRALTDPRNSLVELYLRAVELLRPRALLMENVTGMLTLGGGKAVQVVTSALISLNYTVSLLVLQAGAFGLPQNRWRIFILGVDKSCSSIEMPRPTHAFHKTSFTGMGKWRAHVIGWSQSDLLQNMQASVSVKDAISDLPLAAADTIGMSVRYRAAASSDYQKLLRGADARSVDDHVCANVEPLTLKRIRAIPPGGGWLDLPKSLQPGNLARFVNNAGTFSSRYGRLAWKGTFATIVTKPEPYWGRYIHPESDRLLSVRECARAQSFPDAFSFSGSLSSRYRQIGNAVPPLLGKCLGIQIRKALEK